MPVCFAAWAYQEGIDSRAGEVPRLVVGVWLHAESSAVIEAEREGALPGDLGFGDGPGKGGVCRSTRLSLLAGKITRQMQVVDLDENIIVEAKSTRGGAPAPLKKAKVKRGRAKLKNL